MEFLDPKKVRRHQFILLLGYCLIALAIGIATLLLLYQSRGYDINSQGKVTQNGLIFVSSQPSNAQIYLNGKLYKSATDTRVSIPADKYNLQIQSNGYRTWQRQIDVNGGDVQHFDYPFLFPTTLTQSVLGEFDGAPVFSSQSPDRRFLVIKPTNIGGDFTQYDTKSPKKPVATTINLPGGVFTEGTGVQSWSVVEWATDNANIMLLHTYVSGTVTMHEYIILNRIDPTKSINLTTKIGLSPTDVPSLFNNRTDELYVYNSADQTLRRERVDTGEVTSTLEHILAYKTYSDNKILYITDQAPTGKSLAGHVYAVLQNGQQTLTLRMLSAGSPMYLLNLASYAGDWYVIAGASSENSVYIYRNPEAQDTTSVVKYPLPWRRVNITDPSYVSFSNSVQYIAIESKQHFAVYNLENFNQYHYSTIQQLDTPQVHATWMDGDRLQYISGGKTVVFDYDYNNAQTLVDSDPAYIPFFAQNYSYLYTLRAATSDGAKPALTSTPLTTKP